MNLPKGTCSKCGRTDVVLFKREPWGLSNAPDSTLITYHDDKYGSLCKGGGELSEEAKKDEKAKIWQHLFSSEDDF